MTATKTETAWREQRQAVQTSDPDMNINTITHSDRDRVKTTNRLLKYAMWYASHGLPVFPCVPRSKKPLTMHGLHDATTDLKQIDAWWRKTPDANVAVAMGGASGLLLVDVDPEHGGEDSLVRLFHSHGRFPDTAEAISGSGGHHFYFRYRGKVPAHLADGIDLKCDGGYAVMPPSVHPDTGNCYQWDGLKGWKTIPHPVAPPSWVIEHIKKNGSRPNGHAAASEGRDGVAVVSKGQRNTTLASLAGAMHRRGMAQEAIEAALLVDNQERFDPPLTKDEVRRTVASISRYPEEILQPKEWLKPKTIQAMALARVDPFTEDLLPKSFGPLALNIARRMGVPLDLPAVGLIVCLAGAVSRRAFIQPKQHDTGWLVPPNLWGGLVSRAGFMKSPTLHLVKQPLQSLQAEQHEEHRKAMLNYVADKEQYDADRKNNDPPVKPVAKRLIVNDTTTEKLQIIMTENPAGLLQYRDELSGWLKRLDHPGCENDRAFFLETWSGVEDYSVDRVGRESIYIPGTCLSVLGGFTPEKFQGYLVDAIQGGPEDDGFPQRFQMLTWPDFDPDLRSKDLAPDIKALSTVEHIFRRLTALDPNHPLLFHFSEQSQQLFNAWIDKMEEHIHDASIQPAMASHLSKYRSLLPSLALLFQMAAIAADDEMVLTHGEVQPWATKRAIAWCKYLESHARRTYGCMVNPQLRAAIALSQKIKERKVGAKGPFHLQDVYLKGWRDLDNAELTRQATEVLEHRHWIRSLVVKSGPQGGRPPMKFEVNPRLWEQAG